MDRMHAHPSNPVEVTHGKRLKAGEKGEKMQEGDLFSSITGKWMPVPSVFIGNTIPPEFGATIIRPAVRSAK